MKWEYIIKRQHISSNLVQHEEILNIYGNSGWELVQIDNGSVYYFKRIVAEDSNGFDYESSEN